MYKIIIIYNVCRSNVSLLINCLPAWTNCCKKNTTTKTTLMFLENKSHRELTHVTHLAAHYCAVDFMFKTSLFPRNTSGVTRKEIRHFLISAGNVHASAANRGANKNHRFYKNDVRLRAALRKRTLNDINVPREDAVPIDLRIRV